MLGINAWVLRTLCRTTARFSTLATSYSHLGALLFFMPRTHPILIKPESLGMGCKPHNMFPGGPPWLSRVPRRCTREHNSAISNFGFPIWWVRSGHALLEAQTWVAGCSLQTSCEHILYSLTDSSAKPLLCPLFLTAVWPACHSISPFPLTSNSKTELWNRPFSLNCIYSLTRILSSLPCPSLYLGVDVFSLFPFI